LFHFFHYLSLFREPLTYVLFVLVEELLDISFLLGHRRIGMVQLTPKTVDLFQVREGGLHLRVLDHFLHVLISLLALLLELVLHRFATLLQPFVDLLVLAQPHVVYCFFLLLIAKRIVPAFISTSFASIAPRNACFVWRYSQGIFSAALGSSSPVIRIYRRRSHSSGTSVIGHSAHPPCAACAL
jgi:hypothetical protein